MKKIITFSGQTKAGKNTFINMLQKYLRVQIVSNTDNIEKIIRDFQANEQEILAIKTNNLALIQELENKYFAESVLIRRINQIINTEDEKIIDEYSYNYYFMNSTLEELERQAHYFVVLLKKF